MGQALLGTPWWLMEDAPGRCWEGNPAEPLSLVHPLTQPLPLLGLVLLQACVSTFIYFHFHAPFPFGNSPLKTHIFPGLPPWLNSHLPFPPDGCLIHIPWQGTVRDHGQCDQKVKQPGHGWALENRGFLRCMQNFFCSLDCLHGDNLNISLSLYPEG